MRTSEKEQQEQMVIPSPPIGAYAPGISYGIDFSQLDLSPARREEEFKENKGRLWKDSVAGRGAIRMISRGVMGATAFAWAWYFASPRMAGYNPKLPAKNFVQRIAKTYDVIAGTPIKGLVNALGYDGEKFLTFRPTLKYAGYEGMGRSLGHEVVGVTFDFGAMSIGDFWGRKIADALDPSMKLDWVDENGNIDPMKAGMRFALNSWKAVTYAAGEDWAVAVPYVLTMHHIGTPLMNKAFPGYRRDYDRNGCGSSLLIDDHGHVRGNFTTAGVFNLWERFTTYNIGTLLFREAYNTIGNKMEYTMRTGRVPPYLTPDPYDPRPTEPTLADNAAWTAKWLGRDAVKASLYMLPAVPFFWVTRVPQHKYRGFFLHPEKGMLMYKSAGEEMALRVHSMVTDAKNFTPHTPVYFSETKEAAINPFASGNFDPNAKTYGLLDSILNPVAKLSNKIRKEFHPVGEKINRHADTVNRWTGLDIDTTPEGRKHMKGGLAFGNTYINAAMSYAPYFWAKSDVLAHAWDNGRTDVAIERALVGAANLKPAEVAAGITEITYSLRGKPLPDPQREEKAQHRIETKLTPPDSAYDPLPAQERYQLFVERLNMEEAMRRLKSYKHHAQSRMDQFKQGGHPPSFAAAVRPVAQVQPAQRPTSFVEQELARQQDGSTELPDHGTTIH